MALTAMGLGTKGAPANTNLDPQRQFWSWLSTFKNPDELGDSGHHERAYFSGFACTQTSPSGMSIQIGGGDDVDSAAIFTDSDRAVLLSTDGTPETVTIPTAPASGSRIDAVVSYIDTSSPSADDETPGTPEYVHTIVVSGTAASSPSAPTDAQIVSALPAGANSKYYRWCDVTVAASQTVITNSNITDRKPMSPNVYLTTSEIQNAAESALQISASSQTGSAQFGGLLIQWGNHVFTNLASGTDGTYQVNLPRRYESTPTVMATPSGWYNSPLAAVFSPSATGFSILARHSQGTAVNLQVLWLAIGKAS